MRDEWEIRDVASVTTLLRRGKAPSYTDSGGILVLNQKCIRPDNLVDSSPQRRTSPKRDLPDELLLRVGDVVICSTGRGTLGRAAGIRSLTEVTTVDAHVTIARANEDEVIGAYLALVLSSRFEELVALGSGSTNQTELSADAVGAMKFLRPPVAEQRRIVDLVDAVDVTIQAASATGSLFAHSQVLESWMQQPGQPFARALTLSQESVSVTPDSDYRILGLRRSGHGFIDRGELKGSSTSYARLFRVRPNQLVYRKLTAWEGPISVSTGVEDKGWVSSEFPVFDIDDEVLLPDLLRHMCRWPGLWHLIGQRLVGSVQRRKRLNPEALLGIEVPMPGLEEQREVCEVLDLLWSSYQLVVDTADQLRILRSSLVKVLLSGEHEIPRSYDELIEVVS